MRIINQRGNGFENLFRGGQNQRSAGTLISKTKNYREREDFHTGIQQVIFTSVCMSLIIIKLLRISKST